MSASTEDCPHSCPGRSFSLPYGASGSPPATLSSPSTCEDSQPSPGEPGPRGAAAGSGGAPPPRLFLKAGVDRGLSPGASVTLQLAVHTVARLCWQLVRRMRKEAVGGSRPWGAWREGPQRKRRSGLGGPAGWLSRPGVPLKPLGPVSPGGGLLLAATEQSHDRLFLCPEASSEMLSAGGGSEPLLRPGPRLSAPATCPVSPCTGGSALLPPQPLLGAAAWAPPAPAALGMDGAT